MILNPQHEDLGGWLLLLSPVYPWLKIHLYNRTWSFLGEGVPEFQKRKII